MYRNTHISYFLLGFASLLFLCFGLPCCSVDYVVNMDIQSLMNENYYFMQSVTQILSGELDILTQACHRNQNRLQNEGLFERIFKKCLSVAFIRHLSFAIRVNCGLHGEIHSFKELIE
jgi:hypothetical protein